MSEVLAETREQIQQQKLAKATFPNMLERFKGEIARALPRHLNADRMCRIALTEFRKNPRLAECDPRSVFAAIIVASQLGLEPGVLGQAYLIPYKQECQLIIGYQGLIDLVRRSGLVQRIEAHVVRHGEKFTYKSGLHTVLEHEPQLEGTPGALRLCYAVAEFKDGGYHVEVMVQDQVEKIRDRSQAVINAKKYNKTTPWDTDTEEMWRKTVLRRVCKYLPKSPEIATALSLDDAAAQGRQAITVDDAIAGTWQAPVLEVTTDDRLAAKSANGLEEIKQRYAQTHPGMNDDTAAVIAEAERLQRKATELHAELAAKIAAERAPGIEIGPLRAGPPTIAETDPAKAEQLRAVAEKFGNGASQPEPSPEQGGPAPVDPAPAAAEPSAPPQVQEPAVPPEGDKGAEVPAQPEEAGAPSGSEITDEQAAASSIPQLDFGNAPRGKTRKR
jgi:recombination protein RecT